MARTIDPVGVTLAGLNVVVAVVLLGAVALLLSGTAEPGGAFTLLAAVVAILPLFVIPYRTLRR